MQRLPGAFLPEKAGDLDATVQFHFPGDQPEDWVITIRDGACETRPGTQENTNLTITVGGEDYQRLISGDLKPMTAFMQGKLKVSGDVTLAMNMTSYFERPDNNQN